MNVNIHTGGRSIGSRSNNNANGTSTGTVATGKQAGSKLGKIVGAVGNIAAKYGNLIPGVGGIVSTVGKLFSSNDPEWWQHVPSTGVTTNVPLSNSTLQTRVYDVTKDGEAEAIDLVREVTYQLERPAILEILSDDEDGSFSVIDPTTAQVSTYLMQEVRKVLNAVPLQSVDAYRDVLVNSVQAYALKKQLDKWIELAQNSKPFIPSVTDGSFPALSAANFATLQSCRDILKEYIKASVKLPHTMCQYLSWRYGHIFRMGDSEKSGIVLYDVIPLAASTGDLVARVNYITGFVASTESYYGVDYSTINDKPKALADLYNAYIDHVIDVELNPETQFRYDRKEFVLRTNLDAIPVSNTFDAEIGVMGQDLVFMDSTLDNATTFMASTVSTDYKGDCLFPVRGFTFYYVDNGQVADTLRMDTTAQPSTYAGYACGKTSGNYYYLKGHSGLYYPFDEADITINYLSYSYLLILAAFCKACEFYNVELYVGISDSVGSVDHAFELTSPSTDLAFVQGEVIANTHTYAFANLVYAGLRNFEAKKSAELAKEAPVVLEKVAQTTTPGPDPLPPATAATVATV